MKIEQIYTGCLAQGAYYIENNGQVAIVDPLREVAPYINKASAEGGKIQYVLETHFHADFVSGHLDLAEKTGAQIIYGPTAQPDFKAIVATDGQQFPLGDATIVVMHTPGHTMENTCYLLRDAHGKDIAIFTGDTLFIGDVGRPDLAQKVSADLTPEKLAGHLFDSLRNKIMDLPDDIIVYPAHGAGSACGKNMSRERSDTLGHQKQTNYALRKDITKEAFIKSLLTGLTPPPGYFPSNVMMNKQGYESIDEVLKRGNRALSPAAFEAIANETGALILDTRDPHVFAKAFIPNAVNIGINGNFAPWAGALIPDIKQPILIVAEPGRETEVITRLARVGCDYCIGYLEGGFSAWESANRPIDQIRSVDAGQLAELAEQGDICILDVRKQSEYESEHLESAKNAPLDYINESMLQVDKSRTCYVHCAGGYRSMIFISILKARGYDKLVDIKGGFQELKASGRFRITSYVCPTTML